MAFLGLQPLDARAQGRVLPASPVAQDGAGVGRLGGIAREGAYLRAQLLRLKGRRGPNKKAAVAVAASILTAAYHMSRDNTEYRDLGSDYFVRRDSAHMAERLARRIRQLGYEVQLQKAV